MNKDDIIALLTTVPTVGPAGHIGRETAEKIFAVLVEAGVIAQKEI
jgi:hypothetical protein